MPTTQEAHHPILP